MAYQVGVEIKPSEINFRGGKQTYYGTQANHIVDSATNVAAAAGATPTKAEFDALVTAYNALATRMNALLAAVEGVGILKTS